MELIVKNIKNMRWVFAFTILCTLVITGCKKEDGFKDVGISEIYIPQAAIPGVGNYYTVPSLSAKGKDTYNFKVDNGKLNVFLSVARGGKISNASGFSVNVVVSSDDTNAAVAAGKPNAWALPSDIYAIPGKATVEAGKTDASFFLSIDINALTDGTYSGQKLFLALRINNPIPDTYAISGKNNLVIVVIDVDAMKPFLISQ